MPLRKAACKPCWRRKWSANSNWPPGAASYDDLTNRLRTSDERRLQLERALEPLRARITEFQLKEQAARLGLEQYTSAVARRRRPTWRPWSARITEGNVRLMGLQAEIDRLHREIARPWAPSTWLRWMS